MFISNTEIKSRIEQHQNVVDAAKVAGVKRIVYTSFIAIDGDDSLATSHRVSEAYVMESGLAYTFLGLNFYMDMYFVEVEIVMKVGAYRTPTGDTGAAFVTRADIARVAATVLTSQGHEGRTNELTGPSVVKPADFAGVAADLSEKDIRHHPITWDELAEEVRRLGMPEAVIPVSVMLEKMIASTSLARESHDIEKTTGCPAKNFPDFARLKLGKGDEKPS
jgi:NAD(P)H dehydrogenase (quinone)